MNKAKQPVGDNLKKEKTPVDDNLNNLNSSGKEKEPVGDNGNMGVTEHLRELRKRLLICLGAFVVALLIGLYFSREMVLFLLELGEKYDYNFIYIAPQELLVEYFAVDFAFALCVILPVLFYEIWAFLKPGLTRREKILFPLALLFGTLCAILGVFFAYKILLPFMLRFLISLSDNSGIQAAVSVQNYISFLLTIFIIFAVIFELPAATLLLTRFKILKVSWMKKFRRPVIVLIFFIAAVITPPDIVSQIMVAIPLIGLYELSVILCSIADKFSQQEKEN